MSIKHINNQPCSKCNKDTMHLIRRCMECGNIEASVYELRVKAHKRRQAKMSKDSQKRIEAAERYKVRNAYSKSRFLSAPDIGGGGKSVFDRGKGRRFS